MTFVQYHRQPELRNPVLIAAFAGWNDAADSATTSIKFLVDRWKPIKFAEIEPEEFYVFTETRPETRVAEGIQRSIIWPSNQFLSLNVPEQDRDIILYLGVEPQLKWKAFTNSFLEVCKGFHVSEVVLLGALLANIPHSMEVPTTGYSSDAKSLERLHEMGVHSSGYEGPTGIIGVLSDACSRAGIAVTSLWAAAPHYLAATPNIKVTSALLTYLNLFLSLGLDLSEIQSDAVHFEEQITALVARDPEASAYVQKLEEQIARLQDEEDEEDEDTSPHPDQPTGTGPLPSADILIQSVEELLRKERENGQQNPNDGEDDG
jgi:proteasome assembly chaperone (PAC2) family protein